MHVCLNTADCYNRIEGVFKYSIVLVSFMQIAPPKSFNCTGGKNKIDVPERPQGRLN